MSSMLPDTWTAWFVRTYAPILPSVSIDDLTKVIESFRRIYGSNAEVARQLQEFYKGKFIARPSSGMENNIKPEKAPRKEREKKERK